MLEEDSFLTPRKFMAALHELENYFSGNLRSMCFLDEDRLVFCLAKGKIPSKRTITVIENMGMKYDKELNVVYIETPNVTELLTHPDKRIREQAKRHYELRQKCRVTDSP